MGLNIKNDRVHDLARQAAEALGTTMTGAIEMALTRLLADEGLEPAARRRRERDARIDATLARIDAIVTSVPAENVFTIEDLYDPETGLPA
ncbi:MAG: type II toxin-antitoxin system VapB family antitoxin [Propionibacteriaceae bacterium]|nr:type II toxin-antitoxin system VapB family antitoxin [Propionibacteriaceae bacterium]